MAADHAMPRELGRYELRGVLGKGAMGVVYDAWDPGIERRVALKTIRLPGVGDSSDAAEYDRFRREGQAAGRLNHPGIVGIYDSGEVDGTAYIAMELIDGQSLKDLLDAEHRLTPADAVRLMRELLDALAYSHSCGVIHRDIKPTNILVTRQGRLKITDFGIARIESSSLTQIGTVMGTPAYMSPEQFMGQTADQRTDIYAAGVLLYQLLTGERPFEGGMTAIMHKVLHTVPPKPSQLSVTAPEAFDAVIAKAMARRPDDRYESAAAFEAALTQALTGGPALRIDGGEAGFDSDATMVTSVRRQPTLPVAPTPQPPAKRPIQLFAGIAFVIILLGAGSYWLLRPLPKQPEPSSEIVAASPPAPAPPQSKAVPPVAAIEPSAPVPPVVPVPAVQAPAPPQTMKAAPTPLPVTPEPLSGAVTAVDPASPAAPVADTELQSLQSAAGTVACTLLDVVNGADRPVVTGLVGSGIPEEAARAALAATGPTQAPTWAATRFDGPYCPVVDTLRKLRSPNGPSFELSLRGGRTRLRNGEIMAPLITAPSISAYLQLAYFQSNRVVVHLSPTKPPDKPLPPDKPVQLGDPRTGGWPVGDPFGSDMMVAIMSSAPMPLRPLEESSDTYLAALERAAAQITRDGGTISVRAVKIQTYK